MNRLKANFEDNYYVYCILGFQLFRLAILPFMGLMPQDAYYYMYGQNLDFSYFDHPGMVGYMLRFFTTIFGKSILAIKLADFLTTSVTLYLFYYLASLFLSKSKLKTASILIISSIFISILSFNSTPDVPLLLFWTLSIIFLYKAIFENKNIFWVIAGISMGFAFNSKYTSIFLQIGLFIFVLLSKNHRKFLLNKWFWTSIFISILFCFPVLYWNYTNSFISFKFQATSRGGLLIDLASFPKRFLGTLGHQILLLIPFLFVSLIVLIFKYFKKIIFRRKLPSPKILFLLSFFAPTFLGFFSLTPIYWIKLNWMMPSYITGIILASIYISNKFTRLNLITSTVIHSLVALQIIFYLVPVKSDDTWVGWKELSMEIENIQKKYPNTFIFSDDGYKTTASLDFFTKQKIYAQNIIDERALQYDYLNDSLSILNGKNALFIDSDTRFNDKQKSNKHNPKLNLYFDEIIELQPIIIKRNKKDIRKFWVYYCKNYQNKNI